MPKAAWPFASRNSVSTILPSTRNHKGPLGVPAPGATAVTVAMNTTPWPTAEGFCVEISAVAESALLMVCVSGAEILAVKLLSPLYVAVMLRTLGRSELVDNIAFPVLSTIRVPRLVVPSLKVIVPVGVPAPGGGTATVAVKVTLCPKTDGFGVLARVVVVVGWMTVTVTRSEE